MVNVRSAKVEDSVVMAAIKNGVKNNLTLQEVADSLNMEKATFSSRVSKFREMLKKNGKPELAAKIKFKDLRGNTKKDPQQLISQFEDMFLDIE